MSDAKLRARKLRPVSENPDQKGNCDTLAGVMIPDKAPDRDMDVGSQPDFSSQFHRKDGVHTNYAT
jgi:hypothetical protein